MQVRVSNLSKLRAQRQGKVKPEDDSPSTPTKESEAIEGAPGSTTADDENSGIKGAGVGVKAVS